jgi:two-component system sensor histidine kinase TctE
VAWGICWKLRVSDSGSLRGRLIRRLALLFILIFLIGGLGTYRSARQAADTAYDRTLLASARSISDGLYAVAGKLAANVPYIALDSFAYDSAGRIYYQVLGPQGELISGYEQLPPPPAKTPRTNDYPALAKFYDGEYRGQQVRVVSFLRPVSGSAHSGMAEIRVAETLGARERMIHELLFGTFWRLAVLLFAALLLVWLAVTVGLRPLETLRRSVVRRSSDDLSPLPDWSMPRELQPLVSALNQFNDRLRGLFERQSQFIAEASHELRTPLAALKARTELGLRDPSPEIWHLTLQEVAQNASALTHLANQLLSLARIESGARAVAEGGAQVLDLSQLARELAMAMVPLARTKGITLALEAEQAVWIRGEPTLLNELLYNLLDNALAYSEKAGSVVLRVQPNGVLEVQDNGPGIPESEHARVFQRFYRRHAHGHGAGLGLSIVGEICKAHRATISLHPAQPNGLLVRVAFVPGNA